MKQLDALNKAITLAGSQEKLADLISKVKNAPSYTQGAISQWKTGPKRAPAEAVIPIELALGGKVTRHQLRPDLYPKD